MQNELPEIVLASGSPRRRRLLRWLGIEFDIHVADVDETVAPDEPPCEAVARLGLLKAQTVMSAHPAAIIIAADTMVVLAGEILGKPAEAQEAYDMLSRLRGRWHEVYTGLTLLDTANDRSCQQTANTAVHMRNYTDQEMRRYIATGDPMDKAGAYAIQHPDFCPVDRIEGCYANVVGLPLGHLYQMLRAWGYETPSKPPECCDLAGGEVCSVNCRLLADRSA